MVSFSNAISFEMQNVPIREENVRDLIMIELEN